jgi:lactoylglutathione lyase
MLEIERFGIILNVSNFDECVSFYKSLFGLPEIFSKVDGDFRLTCLEFGSAYLMIENGGIASASEKSILQSPTILRFNVVDIDKAFESVLAQDGNAKLIKNDWGTIIRCIDPDGNPISIRDSSGFKDT